MKICISAENRQLIKKTIGVGYAKKIFDYLIQKNITNSKGKPFSESHIRNILTGAVENDVILKKILELYEIRLKERLDLKKQRERLFKK